MRRFGLVLVMLSAAGCGALSDAFSAHPQSAASAAGQTLSVTRLAELASQVKGMPMKQDALKRLAGVYVDFSLLASELAAGKNLDDSTTVLAAVWPMAAQRRWEHFHDRLVAGRVHFTDAQLDSVYRAGDYRLFQHLLLEVASSAAPTAAAAKQAQAERLLRQAAAEGGRGFAALAKKYSDDPGSKASGGYLPVRPRGAFVPTFEDAAWQLAPGGMSGVVRSPFGFHIIRRPPLAEVADSFRAGLENLLSMQFDSTYLADIAKQRDVKVDGGAAAAIRSALQDPEGAAKSRTVLVTFHGGPFRMRDLIHWLNSLDPNDVQQLPFATDDQIGQFLKVVATRTILLQQADSAKVTLTPQDWQDLKSAYDSMLATIETQIAITPKDIADSAKTPDGRERYAMSRVDGYLDKVVRGQSSFVGIPPVFSDVLRGRAPWSISESGVARAVEIASGSKARADSQQQRAPGLRPAPGPAPAPPGGTVH